MLRIKVGEKNHKIKFNYKFYITLTEPERNRAKEW